MWDLLIESFSKILLPGLLYTIPLTLLSFAFAMIIGIVNALIQYAKTPILFQLSRLYVWIIRGTPLLVQLMVAFYGMPALGLDVNAFVVAVIVFAINEGAYACETLRGNLAGVAQGQVEAAYCVGLNFLQIMWHIVIPQALRTAFPALSNELISMVKDTSLASNITVTEMFLATRQIAGRTYEFLPLYLEVAIIYLLFSTVLTWLQHAGEKRLAMHGKRK